MKCDVGAVKGTPEDGLTVGTAFELSCESAEALIVNAKNLNLVLPEADKFSLRILETRSIGEHSAQFVAASYKAGLVTIDGAALTDGVATFPIEKFSFQVQSVLDPNEQPPQPIAPFLAEAIHWPLWVFILIAGFLLAVGAVIAGVWRRLKRRKSFELWLNSIATPMSPFDQLNKELRYAARERDPLKQLGWIERASREYLCKLYHQDFRLSKPKKIAAVIDRTSRGFSFSRELINYFDELERVSQLAKGNQLDSAELLNRVLPSLHDLAHDWANRIESSRKKGRGR